MANGLMADDVTQMAADALFGDLPTKKALLKRNAPRRIEGENVDDYQTLGTWDGRLREVKAPQNQQVGGQEAPVGSFEFVLRPYGPGAQEWRKIATNDRLEIDGQTYTVTGPDKGTSVFLLCYPLAIVEDSGKDAGA